MRQVFLQTGFTLADVTAVLATSNFLYADCFTIEPLVGPNMYYTNYQEDVSLVPVYETVTRRTFFAKTLNIHGLRMRCSTGITVDEQEIDLQYPSSTTLYQNYLSWPQALLQGRLDGARVRRDRYVRQSESSPWIGGWTMFRGLVSHVDKVGRSAGMLKVKSDLVKLDVQMPRDLFEPNCKNTWGDANCGINQADYAVVGTTNGTPSPSVIPWAGASASYALGKVHIANTDSVVRIRTIARADNANLYLAYPLDFTPPVGLSFTAYPGCDRTSTRCAFFHGATWPNYFKGFPFIPIAETAVGVGIGGTAGKGGK